MTSCSAMRGATTSSRDWQATPKAMHALVRRARLRRKRTHSSWPCIGPESTIHARVRLVLKQAGDLSGKLIVTCSLPMDTGNTKLIVANTSSGAEELAKKVPQAQVVSAFNTVSSEVLFGVFEGRRKSTPPATQPGVLWR